ncbi:hypothetical protein Nepgr_033545 [Nepenthes gracilis]|uniref:Uncharacterized protein n=1 Tax=Nepenthes gracilis TaxID=150966 RepID=A0AAD3TM67_NEPGR|nr:hypothetical protein Nepgr_033545 [Nepenthes gracilis]
MRRLLCGIVKVLVYLMPRFLSFADYGMVSFGLLWCMGVICDLGESSGEAEYIFLAAAPIAVVQRIAGIRMHGM